MNTSSHLLARKLETIKTLFEVDKIIKLTPTKESIARYYKLNKLTYTLFHQGNDFIHMGVSRDGTYKQDDLLEYVRVVEKCLQETHAKKILELACGRGANCAYLARKYPSVSFYGLDLPDGQ